MRSGAPLVTGYRLRWLVLLGFFTVLAVWLALSHSPGPVRPEQVKSAVQSTNPPPQTPQSNEQLLEQLRVEMDRLQVSISSSDGRLRLSIEADEGKKDGERYRIREGRLEFAMEDRSTLNLRVEDGVLAQSRAATRMLRRVSPWWWQEHQAAGLVRVSGTLSGSISGTEQYFNASALVWDMSGTEIRTSAVLYRTPTMVIRGECMCLDLVTQRITFEGAVEAGLTELDGSAGA